MLFCCYHASKAQAQQCCIDGYTIPSASAPIPLSIWINVFGLPDLTLTNTCVKLDGSLRIDKDYTFDNVDFFCAPGTRIIVDEGISLTFKNCRLDARTLEGQAQMWHGIVTDFSSSLTMRDCRISNAFLAIYGLVADIDLEFVTFSHNYAGIDLYSSPNVSIFTNLNALTFECPDKLLNHYPNASSNLLDVFDINKSYFAIRANGYDNLSIGSNQFAWPSISVTSHHIGFLLELCDDHTIENVSFDEIMDFSNGILGIESVCISASSCEGVSLVRNISLF